MLFALGQHCCAIQSCWEVLVWVKNVQFLVKTDLLCLVENSFIRPVFDSA